MLVDAQAPDIIVDSGFGVEGNERIPVCPSAQTIHRCSLLGSVLGLSLTISCVGAHYSAQFDPPSWCTFKFFACKLPSRMGLRGGIPSGLIHVCSLMWSPSTHHGQALHHILMIMLLGSGCVSPPSNRHVRGGSCPQQWQRATFYS